MWVREDLWCCISPQLSLWLQWKFKFTSLASPLAAFIRSFIVFLFQMLLPKYYLLLCIVYHSSLSCSGTVGVNQLVIRLVSALQKVYGSKAGINLSRWSEDEFRGFKLSKKSWHAIKNNLPLNNKKTKGIVQQWFDSWISWILQKQKQKQVQIKVFLLLTNQRQRTCLVSCLSSEFTEVKTYNVITLIPRHLTHVQTGTCKMRIITSTL